MLKREGDGWHCTTNTTREARPKSGTASSAKSTAAGGPGPKHNAILDPTEWPNVCVRAYAVRMTEPPNWWPEFLSLYWDCAGELPKTFVQQLAKRWAAGFRLPAKSWVDGIHPQPQCPMLQLFSTAWGPQGLPRHLWDKEREDPGPSQGLAELF